MFSGNRYTLLQLGHHNVLKTVGKTQHILELSGLYWIVVPYITAGTVRIYGHLRNFHLLAATNECDGE